MPIVRGRPSIGLATAVLLAAVPAAAQIVPGNRVRVHAAGQRSLVGTLQSLDETALILNPHGSSDAVTIDRSRVQRVDISQRRGRKGRGGLIGFIGGAALGAALGAGIAADCSEEDFLCLYPREQRGAYMAGSAVALGVVGAVIGAAVSPGEKWGRVPLDRVRVGVLPCPARGVGVVVSFGF
jgi:hypothetical protein